MAYKPALQPKVAKVAADDFQHGGVIASHSAIIASTSATPVSLAFQRVSDSALTSRLAGSAES